MKPPAETLPALLALRRRDDPGRRALVTDEAAITYAELDDASGRQAQARLTAP